MSEAGDMKSELGWFTGVKATIQAILFGYDYFISYRSRDAADFAGHLFAALEREGFDCFLDRRYYEAGHNLRWMQTQALKRSTKLLLVVSPGAHVSPAVGTDWVLAEILEFKHLHLSAGGMSSRIVPIGTLATLDPANYPDSKLLPEIPAAAANICVLDDGATVNGQVAPASIAKLRNDFRQVRRRRVRWGVSALASAAVIAAAAFGIVSQVQKGKAIVEEQAAQRKRKLAEAFRLLDRGRERLGMNPELSFYAIGQVKEAQESYDQSEGIFGELKLDPVMVLHHRFASSLRQLRATPIGDGGKEASYLMPSADGSSILVVYDYAAPSGSPDREKIPDWTSFGVFDLRKREWVLKQPLGSGIGGEMYDDSSGPDVVAFEAPGHVIVRTRFGDEGVSFSRWSLRDGTKQELSGTPPGIVKETAREVEPQHDEEVMSARKRINEMRAPERLFVIQPRDGIDRDYGPRQEDETYVESSDGRSALIGTYEGRLILLDLTTGRNRGEMMTDTIYAAAFSSDGSKGYFCDGEHLWEVDVSLPSGVLELQVPSMDRQNHERAKAVVMSDVAQVMAIATSRRLLVLDLQTRQWREWAFPGNDGEIAALQIDPTRMRIDVVTSKTGAVASVAYKEPDSRLEIVKDSAGPRMVAACFDPAEGVIWLADRQLTEGKACVRALLLPAGKGKEKELKVTLKENEDREGERVVHAIAREADALRIFHGDDESSTDDGRKLLDEEVLEYPLAAAGKADVRRQILFPAQIWNVAPDPVSLCPQVSSVLPGLPNRGYLVATGPSEIYSIAPSGDPEKSTVNLFARRHQDSDLSYTVGIGVKDNDAWVEIRNEERGAILRYDIPWRYSNFPAFSYIAPSGRQLVLASDQGEVVLLDTTRKAWPGRSAGDK